MPTKIKVSNIKSPSQTNVKGSSANMVMKLLGHSMHHYRGDIITLLKKDGYRVSSMDTDKRIRLTVIKAIKESPKFKSDVAVYLAKVGNKDFAGKSANPLHPRYAGAKTSHPRFANANPDGSGDGSDTGGNFDASSDFGGNYDYSQDLNYDPSTDFGGNYDYSQDSSDNSGGLTSPATTSPTTSAGSLSKAAGTPVNSNSILSTINGGLGALTASLNKSTAQTQAQAALAAQQAAAANAAGSGTSSWVTPVIIVGVIVVVIVLIRKGMKKKK